MMSQNIDNIRSVELDILSTRCRYCRNIIEEGAALCHHCGSYQDWKRFVNFSNTFLSLLIALLSVSALTIPIIKKSLWVGHPKVQFFHINSDIERKFHLTNDSIFEPTDYNLDIVAINTGDGMGFIVDAFLLAGERKYHLLVNDNNKRILAANSFVLVRFNADKNGYQPYGYEGRDMKDALEKDCYLSIDVKQISGKLETQKVHLGKIW